MATEVEKARLASITADRTVSDFESAIRAECRAAARAIEKKHQPRLDELRSAAHAAQNALHAAEDAAAKPHKWEGRTVERDEVTTARFSDRVISTEIIRGVVETVKSSTRFPGNKSYGLPTTGQVIVRLLKKDGTPGLQFEIFISRHSDKHPWRLVKTSPASERTPDSNTAPVATE